MSGMLESIDRVKCTIDNVGLKKVNGKKEVEIFICRNLKFRSLGH